MQPACLITQARSTRGSGSSHFSPHSRLARCAGGNCAGAEARWRAAAWRRTACRRRSHLNELWRKAINAERHGPFPRGESEQFIENAGWSRLGEAAHRYPDAKSPQQFLDSIRNRLWSSCWSMSDAEIEAGYQTLLAHIRGAVSRSDSTSNERASLPSEGVQTAYIVECAARNRDGWQTTLVDK